MLTVRSRWRRLLQPRSAQHKNPAAACGTEPSGTPLLSARGRWRGASHTPGPTMLMCTVFWGRLTHQRVCSPRTHGHSEYPISAGTGRSANEQVHVGSEERPPGCQPHSTAHLCLPRSSCTTCSTSPSAPASAGLSSLMKVLPVLHSWSVLHSWDPVVTLDACGLFHAHQAHPGSS